MNIHALRWSYGPTSLGRSNVKHVANVAVKPPSQFPRPSITTYPEFVRLSHGHTTADPQQLRSTLYVASFAAAAVYGTAQFIIHSMLETLQSSRHSLFESASSNLAALNKKLERVVTELPVSLGKTFIHPETIKVDHGDASSESSDPHELFHRDIGTQTSPFSATNSKLNLSIDQIPPNVLEAQQEYFDAIQEQLSFALGSCRAVHDSDQSTTTVIAELKELLNAITYGGQASQNAAYKGGTFDGSDGEIAKIKAEIRGVKGILLSAKTFPGGGASRSR